MPLSLTLTGKSIHLALHSCLLMSLIPMSELMLMGKVARSSWSSLRCADCAWDIVSGVHAVGNGVCPIEDLFIASVRCMPPDIVDAV